MTLLAYPELVPLLENGTIQNAHINCVNSSSIDLSLGRKILIERRSKRGEAGIDPYVISLKNREALHLDEHDLKYKAYYLQPGEFILAQTEQVFHLPDNISAEYKLKSSMARIGLEHLNAGWCDAGWNGSVLTLELKNMTQDHIIRLDAGVPIGQMVFFKHSPVPASKTYAARGRYNNDKEVKGVKK